MTTRSYFSFSFFFFFCSSGAESTQMLFEDTATGWPRAPERLTCSLVLSPVARPELCEQVAGLVDVAKRRGSVSTARPAAARTVSVPPCPSFPFLSPPCPCQPAACASRATSASLPAPRQLPRELLRPCSVRHAPPMSPPVSPVAPSRRDFAQHRLHSPRVVTRQQSCSGVPGGRVVLPRSRRRGDETRRARAQAVAGIGGGAAASRALAASGAGGTTACRARAGGRARASKRKEARVTERQSDRAS